MANQCVTEFTIIGPEEVIVAALRTMVENLKSNGVVDEEAPGEDASAQKLAQWINQYVGEPKCNYLEALSQKVLSQPMGWDAEVMVFSYGELYSLRMDFDTRWGPALGEVEDFIDALDSPCGVYWRQNTDYKYKEMWLKKDGEKESVKLSSEFNRFKRFSGDIDVFYAQMHKEITNRLPNVK